MANKGIKGITIDIGGNTTSLQKALKEVNNKTRDLTGELKQVDRLLKLDPTNTELLAQKQKILAESVQTSADKLGKLKDAQKQVEEQVKHGKIGEEQYRSFEREIISTEHNLKKLESQLSDTGEETKKLAKKTDDVKDSVLSFGDVLSANVISEVAIDAVKDMASAMAELALQTDSASGKVQAALGLTTEEAEKLVDVAQKVWSDGFGQDITEITDNLAIVKQNLGNMSDVELQNILEKAYIISDVFGAEIPESIRAVKTLMQNFGMTAEEAFDLITVGYQNGLDYSGEFIDTINEYSVQFETMGLTAEDAFALLKQGVDNGALSLDKVADSMKEFNIRVKDGSDTTNEGLSLLGINADEVTKKLADGSMTSADAMQLVIDKLLETDDKVLQNTAGVDLFGTQWEDTGSKVILSLGSVEESLGSVKGATEKAGDAAYDNLDRKFTTSLRNLQSALTPASNALLDFASQLMDDTTKLIDLGKNIVVYVWDGVQNMKDWFNEKIIGFFSNSISSAISTVKSAFSGGSYSSGSSSGGGGSSGGSSSSKVVSVGKNGKAPKGLSAGDVVKTAGGNFRITKVNKDGSYKSSKVTKYAQGGVADFTGLAQLDGSSNKSETIFNSTDSKKLYDLVHNMPNLTSYFANMMSKSIGMSNQNYSNNNTSSVSSSTNTENITNNYTINASFPNATDKDSIKQALLSLPTKSLQYAHKG